jgi:hypothetical protein
LYLSKIVVVENVTTIIGDDIPFYSTTAPDCSSLSCLLQKQFPGKSTAPSEKLS